MGILDRDTQGFGLAFLVGNLRFQLRGFGRGLGLAGDEGGAGSASATNAAPTSTKPFLAIGCSLICLKLLQGGATPS